MSKPSADQFTEPHWQRIADALAGLRFGSVILSIHHGRIVQIERSEKFRLDMVEPLPNRSNPIDRTTGNLPYQGVPDRD